MSGQSDEESTVFEVKKTDAGYRISNIDYHPDLLGPRTSKKTGWG